ncbi:MAG: VanZ family protein [Burkholderiales bacterium]|nr:VanZ family protein [Burkholderiales bacterium]
MSSARQRTLLPHALAVLYGAAIVFASLQPFSAWIAPAVDAPFWPFAPWPLRWTRFDVIANVVAYVPFGLFIALSPRRATPRARAALAFAAGLTMSFAMETLQMFTPPRDASLIDLAANTFGALAGGVMGGALVRAQRLRGALTAARQRAFLPGKLGDFGLALLALWLVAQVNPGIALFAVTFGADQVPPAAVPPPDVAFTFIEAAQSAFQLLGVGLFVTLLLRERAYVGAAVLVLIGLALLAKGVAAILLLKPSVWETWLKPGVLAGVAIGLMILMFTIFLPRPVQVATCAIALLASLLLPVVAVDLPRAPLTIFNWRYGHLLTFNGLTQSVLLLWPVLAAAWLFVLAGRPRWGEP